MDKKSLGGANITATVIVAPFCFRYNNQWMIVDYKSFIPGKLSLQKGLLTVLEQIP